MEAEQRVVEGRVLDALPNDLFQVECEGRKITASLGGPARQAAVRILPGDRVLIQLSARDPSRGKIKHRLI